MWTLSNVFEHQTESQDRLKGNGFETYLKGKCMKGFRLLEFKKVKVAKTGQRYNVYVQLMFIHHAFFSLFFVIFLVLQNWYLSGFFSFPFIVCPVCAIHVMYKSGTTEYCYDATKKGILNRSYSSLIVAHPQVKVAVTPPKKGLKHGQLKPRISMNPTENVTIDLLA